MILCLNQHDFVRNVLNFSYRTVDHYSMCIFDFGLARNYDQLNQVFIERRIIRIDFVIPSTFEHLFKISSSKETLLQYFEDMFPCYWW